ncbi:DUF6644 family protein [Novosphingobium rosa]|uniref:DUF6644 family protein n=1 Tax=Novosphingobium rosa TaxID=76978 RepID=UPI0008332791|nr:DUF6644 family protein [Novosphingobium rosa]
MAAMRDLVAWIEATPISTGIKSLDWLIPITQSIHILAIAVVMASIVMLDMRVAGFTHSGDSFERLTRRYLPWVWSALPVLLCSGLVLILGEPGRELLNRFFWYKMTMLVTVVILTLLIQRSAASTQAQRIDQLPSATRGQLRAIASVSLVLWFGIITCGRWIAYA